MANQRLDVKTVGVIGAGVSGVATAVHLRKAGLDVKVFERNSHIGGVWYVYTASLAARRSMVCLLRCVAGYSTNADPKTLRTRPSSLRLVTRRSTSALGVSAKTARLVVPLTKSGRRGRLRLWSLLLRALVMRD